MTEEAGILIKKVSKEVMTVQSASIKTSAHELIDPLPDSASWDELIYHIELRFSFEGGLEDVKAGHVHTAEEVRKSYFD